MEWVVMCQRSNRWLASHHWADEAAGLIVCPGPPWAPECPGGEPYMRVQPALHGLDRAVEFAAATLGLPVPGEDLELWEGEGPETKPLTPQRPGVLQVYLLRAATSAQVPFQIGHEAAHVVLSSEGGFGWRHEMIAVLVSLLWTEQEVGLGALALQQASLRRAAETADPQSVLDCQDPNYPTGIYGWLSLLGADLLAQTGWGALAELAAAPSGGSDDTARWAEQHGVGDSSDVLATFLRWARTGSALDPAPPSA